MPDKFKITLKKAMELVAVLDEQASIATSQTGQVPTANVLKPIAADAFSKPSIDTALNEVQGFNRRMQGVTHLNFANGQLRERVLSIYQHYEPALTHGIGLDGERMLASIYYMPGKTKAAVAFVCIPSSTEEGMTPRPVNAALVGEIVSNAEQIAIAHGRDIVLIIAAIDGFDRQVQHAAMESNGLVGRRWSLKYSLVDLFAAGGVYCNPGDRISNGVLLSCGIPEIEEGSIEEKSSELAAFLQDQGDIRDITLHQAMVAFPWSWRDVYRVFWKLENSSNYRVKYVKAFNEQASLELYGL